MRGINLIAVSTARLRIVERSVRVLQEVNRIDRSATSAQTPTLTDTDTSRPSIGIGTASDSTMSAAILSGAVAWALTAAVDLGIRKAVWLRPFVFAWYKAVSAMSRIFIAETVQDDRTVHRSSDSSRQNDA